MSFDKEEATKLIESVLEDKLGAAVNKSVSDHVGRAFKKQSDAIIDRVEKVVGELVPEGVQPADGGKPAAAAPADDKHSKRIEDLERKLKESEAKEAAARKRETLSKALEAQKIKGLSDFTIDGIQARMEEHDGVFYVGDQNLEDWAKGFARSEEGKRHIPANPGTGTGAVPGNAEIPAGKLDMNNPDHQKAALVSALKSEFSKLGPI